MNSGDVELSTTGAFSFRTSEKYPFCFGSKPSIVADVPRTLFLRYQWFALYFILGQLSLKKTITELSNASRDFFVINFFLKTSRGISN